MLAVRPPEYFPRLPVAALWLAAARVVLADTFAFSRQAAHNRARIRTATGTQWITVPRAHAPVGTPLTHVRVVTDGWARRHGHALRTAYGMAPFYEHYAPEIEALLAGPHASLATLATATVQWTARHLGVAARVEVASEQPGLPASLPAVWTASGEHVLLALAESAPAEQARLEPFGATVRVLTLDPDARYRQAFPGFVSGLSSLDLLMNHGPGAADWLRAATRIER